MPVPTGPKQLSQFGTKSPGVIQRDRLAVRVYLGGSPYQGSVHALYRSVAGGLRTQSAANASGAHATTKVRPCCRDQRRLANENIVQRVKITACKCPSSERAGVQTVFSDSSKYVRSLQRQCIQGRPPCLCRRCGPAGRSRTGAMHLGMVPLLRGAKQQELRMAECRLLWFRRQPFTARWVAGIADRYLVAVPEALPPAAHLGLRPFERLDQWLIVFRD
jgi:hypothetical protein